jgi:glycosyltransferase involved in cell wall biosynthesis
MTHAEPDTVIRRPIACFVNSFGGGGAERNAILIANGMIEQGHDVDMLVERDVGSYRPLLSDKVRVIDLGTTSPFGILSQLYGYLRHTPPRVFFAHLEKPALLVLVAGLLSGYRKIIPCLHVDLDSYATIDHTLRRQFLRLLLGVFYRFAARIASVSNGCKASLAKLIGAHSHRIITVYNGFDLAALRLAAQDPITHPLLANKTQPLFIGCGRLSEQKDFALLIRAFAEVRAKQPCSLALLGEGPQRDMLQALAASLGIEADVHFLGFQPNPFAWFSKCDAFVLSSKSEGLANVLLEAMAAGAPIISTNCPSGPAEILAQPHYGTLVPVNDVPALAGAMRDVLQNAADLKAHQPEIQAYLDRTFAFSRMIAGYMQIVQDVEADPAFPVPTA